MRIGITGAAGLVGYHVRAYLHAHPGITESRSATRQTFSSEVSLREFVDGLDLIVHCAGMNRGDDDVIEKTNIGLASSLSEALEDVHSSAAVAFTNSTHIDRDTAYGRGKRLAGEILESSARRRGAPMLNAVLPHVFGEFGRPFYNSVVSTFCYQLANRAEPRIEVDGALELIHAQQVAHVLADWGMEVTKSGDREVQCKRVDGVPIKVSELLLKLASMRDRYDEDVFPDLRGPLELALFNTLRSYMYPSRFPRCLKVHSDERGGLFETVKSDQGGQSFFSTTRPSVTRGNHYHRRKVERFLVVRGEAEVRMRRLFDGSVITFRVSGSEPAYVDIPTLHTHSITNVGVEDLETLFWTSEIYDPSDSDTYIEKVLP